MKYLFALLGLILLYNNLPAQTQKNIVIQGTIYDGITKNPLPFATISFQNNHRGTIANDEGKFRLIVPIALQKEAITIAHLGYQSQQYSVLESQFISSFQLIQRAKVLKEITVSTLSAIQLVKMAIAKIPINYYDDEYLSDGFYRLSATRDQEYVQLSEAVFTMLNKRENDQFKLKKVRAIKEEELGQTIHLGMKPSTILSLDVVNHLDELKFLSKKGLKNHDFTLDGIEVFEGSEVYSISFDQQPGLTKSLYKGKMYIDTKTFAFLYVKFGYSPSGIQYNKFGSISQKALMALMDIHLKQLVDENHIYYKKINQKYYLSHARAVQPWHVKSDRLNYNFILNTSVEYVVTDIDLHSKYTFEKGDLLNGRKIIERQETFYDSVFWQDYTIILPTDNYTEIAQTIQRKNNLHQLKSNIDERINKFPKDHKVRLDSILSYYHKNGQFVGNALIESDGEILLQKSYNNAVTKSNSTTQFRIGSTSKTFTSMLIMQLQQENKLNISDPVGMYLPNYAHPNITIKQLLTHQSGIPNFLSHEYNTDKTIKINHSLDEMVRLFCSDSLEFEPGTKFHYSNSGYVILSLIIEKITHQPYASVLEEKIFQPALMKDSYFGSSQHNKSLATGYLYGRPEPLYFINNMGGAGGIISTTGDLLKWSKNLDNFTLLDKINTAYLFTPQAAYTDWGAHYAYGWMIDNHQFEASKKHQIIYHPGTDLGFYTMFLKQPDKNITVILLSNNGDFPRFDITNLILNVLN